MNRRIRFGIAFWLISSSLIYSQDMAEVSAFHVEEDSVKTFDMPQITVLGTSPELLKRLPGTYDKIKTRELRNIDPISSNEILRKVPGMNLVDEEGLGLRLNIGIRGLDPDRSRNVLVLEDGIPIALNPYGEPELYFSPTIDKMSGVEVLKGSGQILFGPQTTGGVVNFLTQDPPETRTTNIRLRGGQGGYMSAYVSHGNSNEKAGFLVYGMHKRADQIGLTSFQLTDIGAKFKFELSDRSRLGVKIGIYDEVSNSTYIGLTQTMYDAGGQDFVHMAPNDLLPVRRYTLSAQHYFDISDKVTLKTTTFGYTTTRNWRRQDFSFNPSAANQTGVVWGDESIPDGAVYMLNTTGNRNRQFEVAGVEPQVTFREVGGIDLHITTGARYLYERAFEQFIMGAKPDASAGNMRDNEVRTGRAISAYAQGGWDITSTITLTGGARLENYDYERHILRGRYVVDGTTQVRDTSVLAASNTFAFIPGAGISWRINHQWNIFSGIHRGFAPPRIKDAIDATGLPLDLDAEISTNSELGLRYEARDAVSFNLTAFWMNFDNQIIPVSQSSGNLNATGLANGGATRHAGIELGTVLDLASVLKSRHQFLLDLSATYVDSRYNADRFIGSEQINVKGNKLPYAPDLMLWAGIQVQFAWGLGLNVNANFVNSQFADELNTEMPSPNGRIGLIDSRMVWDASLHYRFKNPNIVFRINGKNLTDARFIASRRPQGIRVGLPRLITAGVDVSF
jgi:Fe(3+) dicitrate transport protein